MVRWKAGLARPPGAVRDDDAGGGGRRSYKRQILWDERGAWQTVRHYSSGNPLSDTHLQKAVLTD